MIGVGYSQNNISFFHEHGAIVSMTETARKKKTEHDGASPRTKRSVAPAPEKKKTAGASGTAAQRAKSTGGSKAKPASAKASSLMLVSRSAAPLRSSSFSWA